MMKLIDGRRIKRPPFAPPFLKAGKLVIGQTANILLYLGSRLGSRRATRPGRLWVHQLQLTITDLVVLIHDTHHPITGYLYYEEQRPAAKLPRNISGATGCRNSCAISSACWRRAAARMSWAASSAMWT